MSIIEVLTGPQAAERLRARSGGTVEVRIVVAGNEQRGAHPPYRLS